MASGVYRDTHAVTVPGRYPLPLIQDSTTNLDGKKMFMDIVFSKACQQIYMEKDDIEDNHQHTVGTL